MATIDVSKCIGSGYGNGWYTNCHARYRVFAGARSTKKSVDILGYEPVFKLLENDIRNILIIRQNETDNTNSTFANIASIIDGLGLMGYFRFQTHPNKITYLPTGQVILFKGFNNPTSQTSIKATHGIFTDVYFEEASELRSYDDFRKVDGSIRIGVSEMSKFGVGEDILQLTFCLNPWNKSHWIYETFFKGRLEDDPNYLESHGFQDLFDPAFSLGFGTGLYLHKGTFRINEFRSSNYDANMAVLKERSPDIYKTEGLGCWGNSTESTYPEFGESLVIPDAEANKGRYSCYSIGIDTGLSNGEGKIKHGEEVRIRSATTMQLVGLSSDCGSMVAIDEFFHSNEGEFVKKTEPELMAECVKTIKFWKETKYAGHPDLMKGTILAYVDCADIGYRQGLELEARRQGLVGVAFMGSTKTSIQTRVDFVRLLMAYGEFRVSRACPNLIREMRNARRGDKGEAREDFDDHAINANEYGWAPFYRRLARYKYFKER